MSGTAFLRAARNRLTHAVRRWGICVQKILEPYTPGVALRADQLIEAMASENVLRNQSNWHEEEWTSGRQETLACDNALQTTADLPRPNAIKRRRVGERASSMPLTPSAVSAYCYSSLADGFIRLLRLMPHRNEHAPIQCQLFDYPLQAQGKGLIFTRPYLMYGALVKSLGMCLWMGFSYALQTIFIRHFYIFEIALLPEPYGSMLFA